MRAGLIAAGILVMGYALVGVFTNNPLAVLIFLAGVLIGHDFVLMPAVIGVGALIGRFVPAGNRAVVRVAALCSLAVTVVALPLVLGYGRTPDNPSALPGDYGWGLVIVLGAIWLGTALLVITRLWVPRATQSLRDHRR
jgi:hypothetical protein